MHLRASSYLPIALGLAIIIIGGAALYTYSNRDDTETESTQATPAPSPTVTSTAESTAPQTTSEPTPARTATTTSSVTYTNAGFSPRSITVAVGDTVTFINSSTTGMWVGSDPHPAHTDYSAFDAQTTIAPGKTWSFTFTKSGTWNYHNHLNDSQVGTVIVK